MKTLNPVSPQTPLMLVSTEARRTSPPLLHPPAATFDSFPLVKHHGPTRAPEFGMEAQEHRASDLSKVLDNEFILHSPGDLPKALIMPSLQSQGQLEDFPDYEAMEVEAIMSVVESSVGTARAPTRSRSVTFDGESSASHYGIRQFHVPLFRLQPRGWTNTADRLALWKSPNATWQCMPHIPHTS